MRLLRFTSKDKEIETSKDIARKGKMKRVLEYLSTVLIALVMLMGLAVVLGPRLGWQVDTVLSGSMTPTIQVGGAVISQKVDPRAIEVGDIITFRSPLDGKMTTHRVTDIYTENTLSFQTKGDANEDPDPFVVPADNVMGLVRLDIPVIGYATGYAKTPLGFILMMAVPGLIIIIMEMKEVWIELSEQEKRKKASETGGAEEASSPRQKNADQNHVIGEIS